eukprot:CAMPEP_0117655384 /NCGR_PEP_ID=MMETSP0804-20121206/4251_1 /TAXON_ID=1074897 /ORGANISM="Tetraselmis astigmatica, Strain CCMP880" /LENGTH=688 /DNA_ID=CAMNT_0005461733 /DNA_START=303 /DNA_END=2368 /DNA_ORIENTATION=-
MNLQSLQALPLSLRKQILALAQVDNIQDIGTNTGESFPSGKEARRSSLADEVLSTILGETKAVVVQGGWLRQSELLTAHRQAAELLGSGSREAAMGAAGRPDSTKWHDSQMRGDQITWLQPPDKEGRQQQGGEASSNHEGEEAATTTSREEQDISQPDQLRELTRFLSQLRDDLLERGLNVGGRMSFQLASFRGGGARYVRHRDRSDSVPLRRLTVIMYLNPEWDSQVDGGQLAVYCPTYRAGASNNGTDLAEEALVIPPIGGTLVAFDSSLAHEVLPSFAPRFALTAWFSCDPADAATDLFLRSSNPRRDRLPSSAAQDTVGGHSYPMCSGACRHPSGEGQAGDQKDGDGGGGEGGGHGLIFVSIVSFRDMETAWTIDSIFSAADDWQRVRVGIVWQADSMEAAKNMALLSQRPWRRHVREVRVDWREATGPCRARHLAESLWAGEGFFLQLDSHMRFASGWDTAMLRWLEAAEAASTFGKAVLSSYPPGYEGSGAAAELPDDHRPTLLCASHFGPDDGLLRIQGRRLRDPPVDEEPLRSLFWAAGLSFSRSQLIKEAPYNPHLPLLFFGEEMERLARMWTAGWDVFAPPKSIVFHLWSRSNRPTFTATVPADPVVKNSSQEAVRRFLAGEPCLCGAAAGPMEGFPLGQRRSLQDFYAFCGVDFASGAIQPWALLGGESLQESSFCP